MNLHMFSHILIYLHKLHVNYCTAYVHHFISQNLVRLYSDIFAKIVLAQINKCAERNSLLDGIFGIYCGGDTTAADSNGQSREIHVVFACNLIKFRNIAAAA